MPFSLSPRKLIRKSEDSSTPAYATPSLPSSPSDYNRQYLANASATPNRLSSSPRSPPGYSDLPPPPHQNSQTPSPYRQGNESDQSFYSLEKPALPQIVTSRLSSPVPNPKDPFQNNNNSEDSSLYDLSISQPKRSPTKSPTIRVNGSDLRSGPNPPQIPHHGQNGAIATSGSNTNLSVFSTATRRVSDKVRQTPASLVRHSRVYSSPDPHTPNSNSDPSVDSVPNGRTSLLLQNKLLTENLPPQLVPVVNLINAQKLRSYASGYIQIPGILASGEKVWLEVEAKLTGNELAIWRPAEDEYSVEGGNDEFTPKYINLIDSKIEIVNQGVTHELKIYQDFQEENTFVVRFHNSDDYKSWLAAIYLSKYEYTSLNEAFTAVILSLKASKLSDIHVLLSSKKRFAKSEWCDLRLPQVSSKWLRVFVVITPGESKKLGRIEMFSSEKTTKKNLVVYMSNVANVYNVYPEHTNMIDLNAIMKLNGDIYVNKNYEHIFNHSSDRSAIFKSPSRSNSHGSLSSLGKPQSPVQAHHHHGHSRTASGSSTASFFNSIDNENHRRTFSGYNSSPGRARSASQTSSSSTLVDTSEPKRTSSFLKKNMSNFVTTNQLYLMPVAHPGVQAIETMIRNFIHIIDSFKLYGRPDHLVSEKSDPQSMLFGLPSLPHYEYLSKGEAKTLVEQNFATGIAEDWSEFQWTNAFKSVLVHKFQSGPYKGSGSISKLYGNLDLDFEEISSPTITFPRNTYPVTSPLSHTAGEFDNLSDSVVSPIGSDQNLTSLSRNGSGNSFPINTTTANGNNGYLGDPVDLGERPTNLRLRGEDLFNFIPDGGRERPLESIKDMPTPMDEVHPYANLVSIEK